MLAGGLYERTSGAAGQPLAGYRRREPERTVLHELVARYGLTMLAEVRAADPEGGGLPRHVERELTEYLQCGVLAHGFARVRCTTCHDEIVVAFSCKRRGLCPSCTARRMADTAAHLVDHVLPRAPYRQWVFTIPKPLRLRLARDPAWTTWVGNLAVRAVGAWQRRAARQRGLRAPRTGAITFVQRFGGLVNLNVHFHLLVPDGVFVDADGRLAFALHPVPTSADVLAILDRIVRRLADEARGDSVEEGVDVLAQVQAEAATTWRSPHNGKPTVRGVERLRAWCEGFLWRLAAGNVWIGQVVNLFDAATGKFLHTEVQYTTDLYSYSDRNLSDMGNRSGGFPMSLTTPPVYRPGVTRAECWAWLGTYGDANGRGAGGDSSDRSHLMNSISARLNSLVVDFWSI